MPRRTSVRQIAVALAAVASVALLASSLCVGGVGAAIPAPGSSFDNPAYNIASPPDVFDTGPCDGQRPGEMFDCASPCYPVLREQRGFSVFPFADTSACSDLSMEAIDAAHAAEHLRPIVLPLNYYSLNMSEQMFVLVNLERITRGIPPLVGLVHYLDDVATLGARADEDPVVSRLTYDTAYGGWRSGPVVFANGLQGGPSIWAGGDPTPASAMFEWMYDDGWGGSVKATTNFDCTSAHASGCWGHRDVILGQYLGTECTTCVAGAGYASGSPAGWTTSYAMIFADLVNAPVMSFTWNADVLPWLTERYERVRAASLAAPNPIQG